MNSESRLLRVKGREDVFCVILCEKMCNLSSLDNF